MRKWSPNDTETSFIWHEAYENFKRLCPNFTNQDEVKDKFYDNLDSVISATPWTDTHPPRGFQCQSGHRPPQKGKRKVQGVPQSQTAALPRPQEEEETDKSKQAQIEQTYEKH